MLASDFEKRKDKGLEYPAFLQPKLDGVRALAFWEEGRLEIMSRNGKSWRDIGTVEHIAAALERILPQDTLFDGEVYRRQMAFVEEGFEGAIIWICRIPNGATFDVVPLGSMEERRAWFAVGTSQYGSMLKVRYFEVSEEGVPRFPVGEGIRAVEDMDDRR